MGIAFWIRRFLLVFAGAACVIFAAQVLQGRGLQRAFLEGIAWAALSASVFTVSRIIQSRRGMHCSICQDTPEMADASRHRND